MRVLSLVLTLCVVCLSSAVRAGGPVAAPAPLLTAVRFAGLTHVPEAAARAAVSLDAGDRLTSEKLEADRKALLQLGFFRSVAAEQQVADGRGVVTYRVVEWPLVGHVRVLGNTVVELRAIYQAVGTRAGQVLNSAQLQKDIRAIEQLYRDRGYVARVSQNLLGEATRSGIIRFEILEVRIQEILVEGGGPAVRQRVQASLREVPPALYRPEAVAVDQQRVLEIRGVRKAVPHVEALAPGLVRIRWLLNSAGAAAAPPR